MHMLTSSYRSTGPLLPPPTTPTPSGRASAPSLAKRRTRTSRVTAAAKVVSPRLSRRRLLPASARRPRLRRVPTMKGPRCRRRARLAVPRRSSLGRRSPVRVRLLLLYDLRVTIADFTSHSRRRRQGQGGRRGQRVKWWETRRLRSRISTTALLQRVR